MFIAYFSKISESLSNGLAAKTAQNVEVCSTKILLMQDWVFRLGKQLYTTIILRIFAHKPHLRADLKSSTGLQANIS